MPRPTLSIALALAAAPAAAAERRFVVTDFDRVQVEGPFEVTVRTGRPGSAVAKGSARALDRVDIEVQGRLLRVKSNLSGWGGMPGEDAGPVTIELTAHGIRSANLRGPGSLSIDKAEAMRFDLSLSGNGRIAIDRIEADTANLVLIGSGRILLGGEAKRLRASVQGAGDLEASKFVAQDAEISSGTTGLVTVGVERAAKVNVGGPGDVEIIGSPACTVTRRGSGRVACGD